MSPELHYEIEFLPGMGNFVRDELHQSGYAAEPGPHAGAMVLRTADHPRALLKLRSAIAVSEVLTFAVPRPKALLGHQYCTAIQATLADVLGLHPSGSFQTLRLNAAGDDSSVMLRLRETLAQAVRLTPVEDEGDLLLRIRRGAGGWEVLVRLTPRPLGTRAWRICNRPGALNGTLAYAMARLADATVRDRVLNLCCGSGTLLVELLLLGNVASAVGCDTAPDALPCALANLHAARITHRAQITAWDVTALPLDDASVDIIIADLPFGQLVGTHQINLGLYPRLIDEAARVATSGARAVLLTHEVRLLDRVLADRQDVWLREETIAVQSGGMTPRIVVLRRV